MPGAVLDSQAQYSPFTGLIYIFNLIVGTGALTLPAAFHDAGWLLSIIIIVLLAFMSYLTATFVVEAMASANALVHHRKLQRYCRSFRLMANGHIFSLHRLKRTSQHSQSSNHPGHSISPEVEFAQPGSTDHEEDDNSGRETPSNFNYVNRADQEEDENEPLIGDSNGHHYNDERFYEITEIFEMGKMASLFFNRIGRVAFYLCLTIYLYGDLAIYGAAVAKTLRDVACTYTPPNVTKSSFKNITEYDPCWESSPTLNRMDAYRIALAVFVVALGPFAFFNVTKTKYLQMLTTLMRWIAFIVMIALACIRLEKGYIYQPPVSDFAGVPNLFGVCVYSFMCHHSLPSLGKLL